MSLKPCFQKQSTKLAILAALIFPFSVRAQAAIDKLQDLGTKGGFYEDDPRRVAGLIINSALGMVGVALLGFIIYAGYTWMTAGGNSDKVEEAKTTIKNCIIGLIITVLAFSISGYVISAVTGIPFNQ